MLQKEGLETGFFDRLTGGGENVVEAVQVAEIISNNTLESTETKDSNDNTN